MIAREKRKKSKGQNKIRIIDAVIKAKSAKVRLMQEKQRKRKGETLNKKENNK